nr:3429_t:CDS:2 [Entrophospora candida]
MGNNVSDNRFNSFNNKHNKKFRFRKFTNVPSLNSKSSKNSRHSSKKSDEINVYIDGRRYLENSKYSLPNDDEEADRLHMQHYVTRFIWQKNFCSPVKNLLNYGNAQVLDVGCGSGTWVLEMASEFPQSQFTGIDISPMYPSQVKPGNVEFLHVDVLKGLPFNDNTFDFVVIRNMITAFSSSDWKFCIQELIRVTKPGGYIESSEFEIPALNRGPVSKRMSDAWIAIMKTKDIDITYSNKLEELFASYESLTNIRHKMRLLPIGKWGERVGEIMSEDLILLSKALGPVLIPAWGIGIDQYNEFIEVLPDELTEYKTFTNIHVIYSQKLNVI